MIGFDASNVGDYLKAADVVNVMLDDRGLYCRHYEYVHFENAHQIPADTFREQLPKSG